MLKTSGFAALAAGLVLCAGSASATPQTLSFKIQGDWFLFSGESSPYDIDPEGTLTGSFDVDTDGQDSLTLPLSRISNFQLQAGTRFFSDVDLLGGFGTFLQSYGATSYPLGQFEFDLGDGAYLGTATARFVEGNKDMFCNSCVSITSTPILLQRDAIAVPEPATWGLMLLGFGLAGAGIRQRRGAVAT